MQYILLLVALTLTQTHGVNRKFSIFNGHVSDDYELAPPPAPEVEASPSPAPSGLPDAIKVEMKSLLQLVDMRDAVISEHEKNTKVQLTNVKTNFQNSILKSNDTAKLHQARIQKWKRFEKVSQHLNNQHITDTVENATAYYAQVDAERAAALAAAPAPEETVLFELSAEVGASAPAPAPVQGLELREQMEGIGQAIIGLHKKYNTAHMDRVLTNALTHLDQIAGVEDDHQTRIETQNSYEFDVGVDAHEKVDGMIDTAIDKATAYIEGGYVQDSPSLTRTSSNTPSPSAEPSSSSTRLPSLSTTPSRTASS